MEERIKFIRNQAKMTQTEFGEKLNIKKSTVAAYEVGAREITDRTIADICRVFNIREEWLREGVGDMKADTPATVAEELARQYDLGPNASQLLYMAAQVLTEMDEETAHSILARLRAAILADGVTVPPHVLDEIKRQADAQAPADEINPRNQAE